MDGQSLKETTRRLSKRGVSRKREEVISKCGVEERIPNETENAGIRKAEDTEGRRGETRRGI